MPWSASWSPAGVVTLQGPDHPALHGAEENVVRRCFDEAVPTAHRGDGSPGESESTHREESAMTSWHSPRGTARARRSRNHPTARELPPAKEVSLDAKETMKGTVINAEQRGPS